MKYIQHRVNEISKLAQVEPGNGVEIDLRSNPDVQGEIYLAHDLWTPGDLFEDWLSEFKRLGLTGPIYLNTKEDGLESSIQALMKKFGIQDFLFLDTAFPTLVKHVKKDEGRSFFLRLSQYEDLDNLMKFQGLVQWLWVDCFDKIPLDLHTVQEAGRSFQLCLVSPELQGGGEKDFPQFLEIAKCCQAICTKLPGIWRGYNIP